MTARRLIANACSTDVYRSVAHAIRVAGLTRDVGRQRHAAMRLEVWQRLAVELELVQVAVARDRDGARARREFDSRAGPDALARARLREDPPLVQDALEQEPAGAAARLEAALQLQQQLRYDLTG